MSQPKTLKPWVKMVLDLGPVAVFFIAYTRWKDDVFTILGTDYDGFVVATLLFIPLILITTSVHWALTGKFSRMQLFVAVMVVFFGGLTIWFNDERFFKIKPTIVYLFFGGVLGVGLLFGRSYLEYVLEDAVPLKPEGWLLLTRRLTLFFVVLAIANECVWRLMSTDAWVNFKTFVLPAALFVFFVANARVFARYADGPAQNQSGHE